MPTPRPPESFRKRLRLAALVAATGLAATVMSPSSGRAQPPGPNGPLKTLRVEDRVGQLVEVGPGRLQLRLPKGGELWQALPAPNARIEVTGRASREMLQPKQFVNCTVSLDALGKVTEPVLQVAFTDGGTPGVMAGGMGIADPKAKRAPGKRPEGSYLVAGTIKQVSGDVVTIVAGREKFDVTVPPEAELVVRSANVGLASPGDEVEVEGQYYQKGQLLVTMLKVTLANPVAPPPPKHNARRPQEGRGP